MKIFGETSVLRGVDLFLTPGEVTAFMGANGAGKSTLVKIVAGVHPATAGEMTLGGVAFAPDSPSDALEKGVVVVHQAINDNVVLTMDVLENLMIDQLCRGGSMWFGRRRLRADAQRMLDRVGLDMKLDRPMADLSLADRQMVAIARALAHEPKLLILDEPTSALSDTEAERLFGVIETLKERGIPVLYISHRMGDIRRLADRIVTLRDGVITGDFRPPLDYEAAVDAMLGAALAKAGHARKAPGRTMFAAKGLKLAPMSPPMDIALREDEVTALVGLVGAGKTEFAQVAYGVASAAGGTMELDGETYAPRAPSDAVAAGVFMASEDRSGGSLVPDFDISQNMTLPFTAEFSAFGMIRRGAERTHAATQIDRLGIVARRETDAIGTLSGGNQQKVVLARWLSKPAKLLILDEPFQGVDIAARRDIGAALRATAAGRATLVLCADLDEAIEVADRIVVIAHHTIVGEHASDTLDRDAVVAHMSTAPVAPVPA
ncbi:sugar ABC transporter ATP-binding protein [Acuticoccus sp. MNP-M23]|uniref:sugar ABC transporter ATP-binding protein n=1 Tax=Acuticoccus sp. MNP-M23 TaxID=3072793 RepID=UPI002815C365|nr:sugar ABC transporter ATP-binding protein [Acuticoccus sp. MNP-M23]WMS43631.1 sugar ABC transporter ATP-binding protein [Acuticoccus sp. MNP-M23]